jgi:hypothetical protein
MSCFRDARDKPNCREARLSHNNLIGFMSTSTAFIETSFANDGFWPDVVVRDWVEGWRIPMDAKDAMLGQCLLQSVIDTNDALKTAKAAAVALADATLADYAKSSYPNEVINTQSVLETLYLSAVGSLAKAKTIKRLQAQQRRTTQETEALAADNTEQYFLDEHQNAVGRILQRMTAEQGKSNFGVYVAAIGNDADFDPQRNGSWSML